MQKLCSAFRCDQATFISTSPRQHQALFLFCTYQNDPLGPRQYLAPLYGRQKIPALVCTLKGTGIPHLPKSKTMDTLRSRDNFSMIDGIGTRLKVSEFPNTCIGDTRARGLWCSVQFGQLRRVPEDYRHLMERAHRWTTRRPTISGRAKQYYQRGCSRRS